MQLRPTLWIRWSNLPYWDREDIARLHASEDQKAAAFAVKFNADKKGSPFMEDTSLFERICFRYGLSPFFPVNMPEAEKKIRVDCFFRQIEPIWTQPFVINGRPFEDGGEYSDQLTDRMIKNEDYLSETAVVHLADMGVVESGYRIVREFKSAKEEGEDKKRSEVKGDYDKKSRAMRQAMGGFGKMPTTFLPGGE